jgi:hypothetical protein
MQYTLSDGTNSYTIDVKTDWKEEDEINFGDFNRLENNVIVTRSYLEAIAYAIPALTTVTNRTKTYIDFLSSINRIEQNLETIRTNFYTPAGYPGTANWVRDKRFDFGEANRLEENIKLLFLTAGNVFNSFVRCGTINAGYTRGGLVASI